MGSFQRKDVWAAGALYERYIGRWSRLVARELLKWLSIPIQREWLDVGCGAGALSQVIFEHAVPNEIKGIDSSADFIAYANAQVGRGRGTFEVGDAQALPIESASFDAVVSGLVLNFVPQPRRAVTEMARVARPASTVAAYVWDYADKMELIRYFSDAAASLDPGALELDEGRRFPICKPSSLTQLSEDAGLQTVEVGSIDIATRFRDFDDYWSPFLGGQGPAPGYTMSLSDELCGAVRERIRSSLPIQGRLDTVDGAGVDCSWTRAPSALISKLKARLAPSLFLILGLFNSAIPGALFSDPSLIKPSALTLTMRKRMVDRSRRHLAMSIEIVDVRARGSCRRARFRWWLSDRLLPHGR